MKKLPITEAHQTIFVSMVEVLYPNVEVTGMYKDGIVILQCRKCLKVTHHHWYELLLDKLVLEVSKCITEKDWRPKFLEIVDGMYTARMLNTGYMHPIDYLFNNYFKSNASTIIAKRAATSSNTHSHS